MSAGGQIDSGPALCSIPRDTSVNSRIRCELVNLFRRRASSFAPRRVAPSLATFSRPLWFAVLVAKPAS
jgi:hypothetical protein